MPGRQQVKQSSKPEEINSEVAAVAAASDGDDAVIVNATKELSSANAKTKDKDDKNKSKRDNAEHVSQAEDEEEEDDDEDDDDDTAACCLCHAAVDFSDLEWFGQGDDIVAQLPKRWHDPNNALIYCDGCNRMYHQKCHFVPLLSLPRGDWFCLICQYNTEQQKQKEEEKKKTKKNNKKNNKDNTATTKGKRKHQNSTAPKKAATITTKTPPLDNSIIYPLLTPDNYQTLVTTSPRQQDAEVQFEFYSRHLKASLWKQELHLRFTRSVAQLVQSLQQAQTELETFTSSHRNRQYFIESTQKQLLLPSASMHSTKSTPTTTMTAANHPKNNAPRRIQQQLHQTVYQYAWRKFQLRQAFVNLSSIFNDTDQTWQELQYYLQHQPSLQDDPSKTTDHQQQEQQKSLAVKCFPFGQPDPEDTDNNNDDNRNGNNHNKTSHSLYCRQRRLVPRTREWKRHVPTADVLIVETAAAAATKSLEDSEQPLKIPTEINVDTNGIHPKSPTQATNNSKPPKNGHHHHHHDKNDHRPNMNHGKHDHTNTNDDEDDDSGITLDDLRCCVCFKGDASDENDLILCDGQGCCRAFHVHCLDPPPSSDVLEQEDDWFCPMCSTLAQSLLQVQAQYLQDEDWQLQRQQHRGHRRKEDDDDDDMEVASVKSWENAFHAFPEAPWQYETALLLKQGHHNDDTDRLLRQILGLDQPTSSPHHQQQQQQQHGNDDGDDMDDEQEDENFDLESFEARRRKGTIAGDNHPESEGNEDNSSHSSEGSLVDVSSVELEISDDELNALSGQEEDDDDEEGKEDDDHKSDDENNNDNVNKETGDANDDDDDDDQKENGTNRRLSRRRLLNEQKTNNVKTIDVGQLNRDNIIWSKRQRKVVDYRRLNDALFGDLDDDENAKMDDVDDFVVATSSSRKALSTTPSTASSVSGEEEDEDENGEVDNEEDEMPHSEESDDEESDGDDDGDSNAAKEERPPKRRRTSSQPRGKSGNEKSSKKKDKKGKLEPTKKAKRNAKSTSLGTNKEEKKKAGASVTRKSAGASTAPPSEKMTTRRNGTHHVTKQSNTKTRKAASSAVAAHRNSKRTSRRNA